MIVIRTNANGTLGHLARTRHLAAALQARGLAVRFLLDHAPPAFDARWLETLSITGLYTEGEAFVSETDDAARSIAVLAPRRPALVIVDDYRLAQDWETAMAVAGHRLAAIDDLQRDHTVELLIEPGLKRRAPERRPVDIAVHLEGPRFALLDPGYAQTAPTTPAKRRTVVLSLGGGGDASLLAAVLTPLLTRPDCRVAEEVLFRPVLGPMAKDTEALTALAARYPNQIRIAWQPDSLCRLLRDCALFVGAAGTAVYELAALSVPALTFSIADNQLNRLDELEAIGHYLHVNHFDRQRADALAACVHELLNQLPRLRALRATAAQGIDGRGCERVAAELHRWLVGRQQRVGSGHTAGAGSCNPPANGPRLSPVPLARPGGGLRVDGCDDRDINRYLDARNRPANRDNMTDQATIDRLEHYRWWWRSPRQSFCLRRDDTPLLYIWHQRADAAGQAVLIGGWFVACEHVDLAAVMLALDWQLAYTDAEWPALPWVAVIRRSNRFVYRMNTRAGFVNTDRDSPLWHALSRCFPNASCKDFHYMHRPAAGAPALD